MQQIVLTIVSLICIFLCVLNASLKMKSDKLNIHRNNRYIYIQPWTEEELSSKSKGQMF